MTAVQIWLWLRLDAIGIVAGVVALVSITVGAVVLLPAIMEKWKVIRNIAIILLLVGFTALPIAVLCPTTKQMAVIYVAPKLMESSVVTNDIPELYDMAVQCLKDKLATAKGE